MTTALAPRIFYRGGKLTRFGDIADSPFCSLPALAEAYLTGTRLVETFRRFCTGSAVSQGATVSQRRPFVPPFHSATAPPL
jgi:hypothetical protein